MLQHLTTRLSRRFVCPSVVRHYANIEGLLTNQEKISEISNCKTGEDVSSYVRFNREMKIANVDQFSELYSKSVHPHKTDHELEELRLCIQQICAEYEYFASTNMRVPSDLSLGIMKRLLKKRGPIHRQHELAKIFTLNTKKIKTKVKKIVKRNEKIANGSYDPDQIPGCFTKDGQLQYGIWKTNLFGRLKHSRHRQRLQAALNAFHWGDTLIFDWYFPVQLLARNQIDQAPLDSHTITNVAISEASFLTLSSKIFDICHQNLQSASPSHLPFNIIHYNLNTDHVLHKYLHQKFETSRLVTNLSLPSSYLDDYSDKQIIYMNPFAEEALTEQELTHPQEKVFIVNPITELFGLRPQTVEAIFRSKEANEATRGVLFRRWPMQHHLKRVHVPLEHYIECLHEMIEGASSTEAIHRHIPKRYFKVYYLKEISSEQSIQIGSLDSESAN